MKTSLTSTASASEIIKDLRLDYDVIRTPLYFMKDGVYESISGKSAYVREDLNTTNTRFNGTLLGIMSPNYVPLQNITLVETAQAIADKNDMPILGGGSFDGGKKVYIQLKSQDLELTYANGKTDRVIGIISLINSHDGSTPLSFGFAHKTVTCSNMFHGGLLGVTSQERLRHTGNLDYNIQSAIASLTKLREAQEHHYKMISLMADPNRHISQTDVDYVFRRIMGVEQGTVLLSDDKVTLDELNAKDVSTRKINQVEKFCTTINLEMSVKGTTPWGLFSGVTRYSTHEQYDDVEKQKRAKMFGGVGNRERDVFNRLSVVA